MEFIDFPAHLNLQTHAIEQERKQRYNKTNNTIEHTENEFRQEMSDAGLNILSLQKNWSEIWATCESKIG